MFRKTALSLLLASALAVPACQVWSLPTAHSGKSFDRTDKRGFTYPVNSRGNSYCLFVPLKYDPAKKYPMIVFLHGLGEGGSDPSRPVSVGIGQMVQKFVDKQGDFPFFVLFPQSADGKWENPSEYDDVFDEIASAVKHYSVDKNHISLTGLSTGGYGVYAVAARKPEVFAALAPMCPAYSAASVAPRLANMNIWAFDNRLDPLGTFGKSQATLSAIEHAGGKPRHTYYETEAHDCWTEAYQEPGFFQFLRDTTKTP